MRDFAEEFKRVAPDYFLQTPNFWFPLEPHFMTPFFHWLPQKLRVWMIQRVNLGQWPKQAALDDARCAVESIHLLTREELRSLFPDAEIEVERVLGLPKSLIAMRRRPTQSIAS